MKEDPGADIRKVLTEYRTVAVVGASPKPERPSHVVARFLKKEGFRVVPVNPKGGEILGETVYPDLTSIPGPVEVVDVFRRAEEVMPVAEEAIAIGAKALWLQEGIVNEEAAGRARAAGLIVVMDRCMKKELLRLQGREDKPVPQNQDGGEGMANTADNLKHAFAGESQASTTYRAFARKADQEGHPQVARLFRAASAAEVVHARNHLEVMAGVKSTEENLKAAIAGENSEHVKMYPDFIQQAKKDGNAKAERTFDWARKVEIIHEGLYSSAVKALGAGKAKAADYYVCQVCGNTVEGQAPDKCPICGSPKAQFLKID
jgi:predicted CoA-binding protein/rubrerythrin